MAVTTWRYSAEADILGTFSGFIVMYYCRGSGSQIASGGHNNADPRHAAQIAWCFHSPTRSGSLVAPREGVFEPFLPTRSRPPLFRRLEVPTARVFQSL